MVKYDQSFIDMCACTVRVSLCACITVCLCHCVRVSRVCVGARAHLGSGIADLHGGYASRSDKRERERREKQERKKRERKEKESEVPYIKYMTHIWTSLVVSFAFYFAPVSTLLPLRSLRPLLCPGRL